MSPPPQTRRRLLEQARSNAYTSFQLAKQKLADVQTAPTRAQFIQQTHQKEDILKLKTMGLQNVDEFREKRMEVEKGNLEEMERERIREEEKDQEMKEKQRKERKKEERMKEKEKNREKMKYSFDQGEEDEEEVQIPKKKIKKNPEVDTSFLPDKERQEQERIEREQLKEVWLAEQEVIQAQEIELTFSFWDGTGRRAAVKVKKGNTIYEFLEKAKAEFPELKGTPPDNLLFIKEDLIIPHHYTFYQFIINKARGKSGPLFSFDVNKGDRLLHDATVEKLESEKHAGKVCERSWYEKNKHIFPASRWEVYDPTKTYGKYIVKEQKKQQFGLPSDTEKAVRLTFE